jgi:uncharacterized membrane protein YfcA
MSAGHHIDHIIRGNQVGWPITPEVNSFTVSLAIYPAILIGLYLYATKRVGPGFWVFLSGGGAIFLTPVLLFARWMPTRDASGTSVAFVWINSLTALAGLVHASGTLPRALPVWLAVVAVGALIGSQLGLRWLPVKGLRYALSLVLVVAAGKLLLA